MDIVLTVVQYIGIIAFSISGTIVAIKKRTDVVGALIFALLTSFGGGLMRDLILDRPISLLWSKDYRYMALVCIGVSLVCFHWPSLVVPPSLSVGMSTIFGWSLPMPSAFRSFAFPVWM